MGGGGLGKTQLPAKKGRKSSEYPVKGKKKCKKGAQGQPRPPAMEVTSVTDTAATPTNRDREKKGVFNYKWKKIKKMAGANSDT